MTSPVLSLQDVATVVVRRFETDEDLIRGHSRKRVHVMPRHGFIKMAREYTGKSYPQIGEFLNRDHTSIMHGDQRCGEFMKKDFEYRKTMTLVDRDLQEIQRAMTFRSKSLKFKSVRGK